jgi:hypothetical protein
MRFERIESEGLMRQSHRNGGILVCPAHGTGSLRGDALGDRPWVTVGPKRHSHPVLQAPVRRIFIA